MSILQPFQGGFNTFFTEISCDVIKNLLYFFKNTKKNYNIQNGIIKL